MEECLFRAVPMSLAAIVGARYGRRGLAIGIAVVVQALVFGAAHANYPGFPSYSRLIELIVPAMLWALIFLRFGLVPTILLHAPFRSRADRRFPCSSSTRPARTCSARW